MAAITTLKDIRQGAIFATWDALKLALNSWAIRDKFTYRTPKKTPGAATYTCKEAPECPWKIRVSRLPEGVIRVIEISEIHTCLGGSERGGAASQIAWLIEAIPQHLLVRQSTKSQDLIDCVRLQYGEIITYQQAHRTRAALLEDALGDHRYSFKQLPAYGEALLLQAPGTYFRLDIDPETRCFSRVFICPRVSRTSYSHCQQLIALDGTFLTGRFKLVS
jgi:MuDR family transposase